MEDNIIDEDPFFFQQRSQRKKRVTKTFIENPKDADGKTLQTMKTFQPLPGSFGKGTKRPNQSKRLNKTKKRSNSVKVLTKSQRNIQQTETVQQKLAKIPLSEDEQFLEAVKNQLYELKSRLKHEILQKFQLLKQLNEMKQKYQKLEEETE